MAYFAIDNYTPPPFFLSYRKSDKHGVARQRRLSEFETLAQIYGAPSRQGVSEAGRNPARQEHAVGDAILKTRGAGKVGVGVQGVVVAAGSRKGIDIAALQLAFDLTLLAFLQFIVAKAVFRRHSEVSVFFRRRGWLPVLTRQGMHAWHARVKAQGYLWVGVDCHA